MYFSDAPQIVDLYPGREQVSNVFKLLFAPNERQIQDHRLAWWQDLETGMLEKILAKAVQHVPDDFCQLKSVRSELGYLEKNKQRMRYAESRARWHLIGSGVVTAG